MNVLRINMGTGKYQVQDIYPDIWGRRFIAEVLNQEVPSHCHPLGPRNKLIFAVGPLAGTGLSSASRLSVGGKSPLTGGAKESNSGGTAAEALARCGFKAIIVEGQAATDDMYILRIGNQIGLEKRNDLRNTGTYELCQKLRDEFGTIVSIVCIGPAGEQKLSGAGVAVTDMEGMPGRYAGRGGLGALMGSKGLKAIVIEGNRKIAYPIQKPEEFAEVRKKWNNTLLNSPHSKMMAQKGTMHMFSGIQALGGIPVNNYRYGQVKNGEQLVSAEALAQLIEQRGGKGRMTHGCMAGCIVRCSNIVPDENGNYLVSPLEYENAMLLGANLGILSLPEIARLNYLCNDLGLDTVETGGAIGVAMEAGVLAFGDVRGAEDLLEKVRRGEALGRVIGCGVATTAKVFGITRAPQSKGQGFAAYDPRAVKGLGVTYATSPMGADHTAGMTVSGTNPHSAEGQVELSKQKQFGAAAFDAAGLCAFLQGSIGQKPTLITEALNAVHGTQITSDDFYKVGRETVLKELAFNEAAGISSKANYLPEFLELEPFGAFNLTFDVDQKSLTTIFLDEKE